VVLPLHDPVRVAEEWAVVDGLSGGRAEIAFSTGWHANDFALAPDAYADRVEDFPAAVERFTTLWRGGSEKRPNGNGEPISIGTYPRPRRRDVPLWLSGQSDSTFLAAARRGMGIVTNFTARRSDDLARRIALYRSEFVPSPHAPEPRVGLMLHTYVNDDARAVEHALDTSYAGYVRRHLDLQVANESTEVTAQDRADMVAAAKARLLGGGGLVGGKAECARRMRAFADIGVTEIACLVDFGLDPDLVVDGLDDLDDLVSTAR